MPDMQLPRASINIHATCDLPWVRPLVSVVVEAEKGKAPLRLAAQKSRPHAPSVPMRSATAYFLCKWGV